MNKMITLKNIATRSNLLKKSLSTLNQYCELNNNNVRLLSSICVPSSKYFDYNSQIQQRRGFQTTIRLNESAATASTEKVVGAVEQHDFMAETKQLLNIVAKSLYSEKEVFIRELISNASDAIEKMKYIELTQAANVNANSRPIPFEIHINANDINNTLTIQVIIFFTCDLLI
jgi:3-methyladenine DNA glycosylase AlkC